MKKDDDKKHPPPADSLERLADFTRKILAVPKEEIAEVEAKQRAKKQRTKTKAHA